MMMRPLGIAAGIGVLAAGAIGIAVAIGRSGEHAAADAPAGPTPSPEPNPAPRPMAGISWSADALLPEVLPGGVEQSRLAAAIVGNLDANDDGVLEHADGAGAGAAAGGWGAQGPTRLIDALIRNYDASGDTTLDATEAASIGSEVAVDGRISPEAAQRLYASLRS